MCVRETEIVWPCDRLPSYDYVTEYKQLFARKDWLTGGGVSSTRKLCSRSSDSNVPMALWNRFFTFSYRYTIVKWCKNIEFEIVVEICRNICLGIFPWSQKNVFYKTFFCYCAFGQGRRVNYSIDFHQIWNRSSTGPLQRPIKMHKKNFWNILEIDPLFSKKNSHKEVLFFLLKFFQTIL